MMRVLNTKEWATGFVTHADKHYPVRYMPGAHGKIALYIPDEETPERKGCFFWYNKAGRHRRGEARAKYGFWSRYPDLYTLYRGIMNMQWRGALEVDALIGILNDLQGIHLELFLSPDMSQKTEEELRVKLGGHVRVLRAAFDLRKVEALQQIRCVFILRDKRDRKNIAVLQTRNLAAQARIACRIEDSRNVAAAIGYYRGLVRRLIVCSEMIVDDALTKLRKATANPRRIVQTTLTSSWLDARQLTLPPFTTTSGFVCEEIHGAAQLLAEGPAKTDEALTIARRAIEGLRLKQIRAQLERALFGLSEANANGGMTDGRRKNVLQIIDAELMNLDSRRITEAGFKKPVRSDVVTHLRTVRNLLATKEASKERKTIENAKETLKEAVALL
ncbi:hypothetical protein HY624_03700 [Candidatus Uhrbacteria bacterium]|nr:hypothetical protein [Candidatus Uhrbacteria bacterium]